jgi:UDP-glucose 4-epimerase
MKKLSTVARVSPRAVAIPSVEPSLKYLMQAALRTAMRVLVTGSPGHLGEALVRTLETTSHKVVGLDIMASHFTGKVGSIVDRSHVKRCMKGVDAVLHTAALHKPHVITHGRQDFIDTNITGTLVLLEESASVGVNSFVFTSTTSAFGAALTPLAGAPAVWVTEDVPPIPRTSTA